MQVDLSVIISAVATLIATVVGIFFRSKIARLKVSQDEFTSLIETNRKFREEMRAELQVAKEEINELKKSKEEMQRQVDDLKRQNFILECEIKNRDYLIKNLEATIKILKERSDNDNPVL